MVNVVETKKLTRLDFNGTEIVVNSEDTVVWNQITVEDGENEIIINEGNNIQFVTDGGILKEGLVTKLSGKKDKTEITITFEDGHKETWNVCSIKDSSLKNLDDNDEEDLEDMEE